MIVMYIIINFILKILIGHRNIMTGNGMYLSSFKGYNLGVSVLGKNDTSGISFFLSEIFYCA